MAAVCFYFQVHQPFRVKPYSVFHVGQDHDYFNHTSGTGPDNYFIARKVSDKCYLPATRVLRDLISRHPEFKITFSISGAALEQFEHYAPEVIESFRDLAQTGNVEFLAETYFHSLSFLYSKAEFERQVKMQHAKVKELLGVEPTSFRNTELIYNNAIAKAVEDMGYKAILAEGVDHILDWRSPNFVYRPKTTEKIKLLLKNYRLSDDIAFRFSEKSWKEWPLTSEKFANWVHQVNGNGNVVNLFMDFETLGEHQWAETGIFDFLYNLPNEILKHPDNSFMTVSEAADAHEPMDEIDIHHLISWADTERDLSAWLGNSMQHSAINAVYRLEDKILDSGDDALIHDWRKLQTSDHFYYMCTKWFADGDVHKYFSPYESPYEAFTNYMNVLQDIEYRLHELQPEPAQQNSKH